MESHPLTPHDEIENPIDTSQTSYKLTRLPSIRPADELPAEEFLYLVQLVREAISQKILPECIAQGSSGSYFCTDPKRKKVGVFKPKNEEPYGHLNPKWMKWLHRNLLPCCFGRSCLIPNLGYISEAGASLIDRRLQMGLVPRTEVIRLSSSSFHYSAKDIEAANRPDKQIPLPLKIGSFQLFLHKYQNASTFLEQNPWPLECALDGMGISKPRSPRSPTITLQNDEETRLLIDGGATDIWTPELQMEFRLQLEKLVIFDYLIRNTDRGLDNWMIQYNPHAVDIEPEVNPFDSSILQKSTKEINIAAIDHGLAFPHKHPDNWRSYPYGWLSLPQSLINRPFSPSIRAYFLPLLSSARWWQQTIYDMRKLFEIDEDFNEDMFQAQMAVLKGQGWNIVESLKQPEEGPIELCNRTPAIVWDEVLDPASSPTLSSPPPDSADQTKLVEQGADPSNFDWPDPFSEQWVAFNKVTPNRKVRKRLKKLSKKAWFRSC